MSLFCLWLRHVVSTVNYLQLNLNITQSICHRTYEPRSRHKEVHSCFFQSRKNKEQPLLRGVDRYWKQNELANQVSRPLGAAVLGVQATLTLCFSETECTDNFCSYCSLPSLSFLLPIPHHGYLFVPSPLSSPLLSDISGTPRTGSPL